MAKSQTLAWKELRVGILVVTSFILLAVAIFFIGGENGFFTPKYNINVLFQSASGLHAGAAVQLNGFTVGNVSSVDLSPQATPNQDVRATLRIARKYQPLIRTNAKATIGSVGLLGDPQVELTRGTTDKPIVQDNGTIQGAESGDIKKIITGTNDVVANLGDLTDQVGEVIRKINNGEGSLGKILNDNAFYDKINATAAEANSLVKDAHTGTGTMGQLISNDELIKSVKSSIDRLGSTMDKVDIIVDKLNRGDGTLGQLINNPSLYNRANDIIGKFGPIADRINNGEGSLGKLSKDDTLVNNLNSTLNRTSALLTTVENGDGTIGKLMKDPTLYNSLSQSSSELQKLMYDFRQNPKKYLTINFRLF
ncbi:MAG TPA: MlaD family protein [Terriglobia bacterium]|nr:MlaD family protein [Terriglobia bacterium]